MGWETGCAETVCFEPWFKPTAKSVELFELKWSKIVEKFLQSLSLFITGYSMHGQFEKVTPTNVQELTWIRVHFVIYGQLLGENLSVSVVWPAEIGAV